MIKTFSGFVCFFLKVFIPAGLLVLSAILPGYAAPEPFQGPDTLIASTFSPVSPRSIIRTDDPANMPRILSVTPAEVTQGQSGNLLISGQHLKSDMRVSLGTGITAGAPVLLNDTATVATLQVTVSPSAAPGARPVMIQYDNRQLPQGVRVTVLPSYQAPAVRTVTPPRLHQGNTYTLSVTGIRLQQVTGLDLGPGVTVTLPARAAITDSRLTAAVQVENAAAPGRRPVKLIDDRGTHATDVHITIVETRTLQVPVAEQPPTTTISRPPPTPAPVMPALPPVVTRPAAPPAAPPIPPSPGHLPPLVERKALPELSFMAPDRWYPGKEYEIVIQGRNLTEDTKIDLGKDIQIKKLTLQNPARVKATIVVKPDAQPGRRALQFRKDPDVKWTASGLGGMVLETVKPVSSSTQVKPVTIPLDQIEFTKGEIVLLTPEFGNIWMMENMIRDTGIPTSNDAQVFTWQEKQVGTSQWFELRILDHQGNIRVTRKIGGFPLAEKFFEPDVNFIMEIFDQFRPQNPSISTGQAQAVSPGQMSLQQDNIGKPDFQKLSEKTSGTSLTADEQYITDNWQSIDCFWQVAGYKTFSSTAYPINTGQGQATGSTVEVAVSEIWPLKLPEFSPTGLICSSANTELDFKKEFEHQGQSVGDDTPYVGDTVLLSGKFTLDGCPWAVGYKVHWGEPEGNQKTAPLAQSFELKGWLFTNVFIDWGDGTWDVVYARPPVGVEITGLEGLDREPGKNYALPNDEGWPPRYTLDLAMTHTYRYSQKFPVRLFVLPESQVGMIDTICQANKAPKGETAPVISRNDASPPPEHQPFLLASSNIIASDGFDIRVEKKPADTISSQALSLKPEEAFTIPGFNLPGSHAFLLYCEPKIIDIKADPASTGPIHLVRLEITEFSGQNKPPETGQTQDTGGISMQAATSYAAKIHQTDSVSMDLVKSFDPVSAIRPASDAVVSSCDEGFIAKAALEYFGLGRVILIWKINGDEIARTIETVGPSPVRGETDNKGQYTEDVKHGVKYFSSPALPLDLNNNAYRLYELTCEAYVDGYEGAQPLPPASQYIGGQYIQIPAIEYHGYISRLSTPVSYRVEQPEPGTPCTFHFPVADGKFFKISNLQGNVTKKQGRYSGYGTLYFQLPDSPKSMATHFANIHFSDWEVPDDVRVTKGRIHIENLNINMDNLPGMAAVLKSLKGDAGSSIEAGMDIEIKNPGIRMVGVQKPPAWQGLKGDLIPEDGWYVDGLTMPESLIYWSRYRISSNDVRIDLSRTRGESPLQMAQGSAPEPSAPSSRASVPSATAPDRASRDRSGSMAAPMKQVPGTSGQPGQAAGTSAQLSQATGTLSQLSQAVPLDIVSTVLQWSGIHLGHAVLYPYLFDLSEITVSADGWHITDNGINGRSKFGHFSYPLGDGRISFDAIDISAGNHQLTAVYQNAELHIPWPEVVLSGGNAVLSYSQGPGTDAAAIQFAFNTQDLTVTEDYGNISMTARIKSVDRLGSGWGITTDTTFNFSDGRNDVVSAEVTDLFFNVFGAAHFKGTGDQVYRRHIPLNHSTTFGEASFTVFGIDVAAVGKMNQEDRIFFTLHGDIDFKELSKADVDVFYSVKKAYGQMAQSVGPGHSEIRVGMNYPNVSDVDALVKIDVRPELSLPGSTGLGWAPDPNPPSGNSFFASTAWASQGVQDTFRGEIDSKMFGNVPLPVKASFRYGKYNGNPYWLTHVNASPIDVMMFAGVHLKAVNGGLAHGFDEKVFENNPMEAIPNKPGATVYSAGIAVASPDDVIYRMNGQLTVNPQDGVYRMAFSNVKLFGIHLTGAGGDFQYSSRVFEGSIYGGFNLYNGAIVCEIPKNSKKVGLYFGSDKWEIWAGRQNNPVTLKLLKMVDTNGYLEFGTTGYRAGGGIYISTGKLCLGVAAGRLFADAQMRMAITTDHLDAGFSISAGLDYWVLCDGEFLNDSISRSVSVNVSVPPLKMSVSTSIDVPDWIPGVPDEITLTFAI